MSKDMDKKKLVKLIIAQCAAQAREGTFLHDFKVFLDYVEKEKIEVTPKLRLIPLKHCRNITALFRQPDPIERKLGRRIYKARSQDELPRLSFIDFLATASGCTKVTAKGYYRKGPYLANFREAECLQRFGVLFLSWWDYFPWAALLRCGGDFAECLQKNRAAIIPVLHRACRQREVDIKQFADEVLEATGVRWESEAGDPDNQDARWGVRMIIIRALTYFEAIERIEVEGEYGPKTVAFSLREPLGKWLVSILPLPPPSLFAS